MSSVSMADDAPMDTVDAVESLASSTTTTEGCKLRPGLPLPKLPKPLISGNLNDFLGPWELKFVTEMELDHFTQVLNQAEFLKIKPLVNLLITRIAAQIKSMSLEEIESLFKIDPPITLEEATKIREENAWLEEPDPEDEDEEKEKAAESAVSSNTTSLSSVGTGVPAGTETSVPASLSSAVGTEVFVKGMVTLISEDGVRIEVPKATAFRSLYIKDMVETTESDEVNLADIPSAVLRTIMEWCDHYAPHEISGTE